MLEQFHQGPVERWTPDEEHQAAIAEMLASKDEIERAYGEAYSKRCYVQEFSIGDDPEANGAAVGDLDTLSELEFRNGYDTEIDITKPLTIGDCIAFGALPGVGKTAAERILDGVRQVEESRLQPAD